MEALEMIYSRRSIRSYTAQKIDRAILDQVLSAALMAPSWKNTQTTGYIVAESDEAKAKVMSALPAFNANTASTASAIILLTTKTGRCGFERDGSYSTAKEDRWQNFDAGIACQTLCLAARNAGLGTCIMGIYDEEKLSALMELPEDQIINAVITIGYPAEEPAIPKRKALEEKVTYV